MSKRRIKKVAVLGSGVMGSRIACHLSNVGCEVLLLDISPKEISEKEKAMGLTLDHPKVKNRLVNEALETALRSNPSPIYRKAFRSRIQTGNFDDNLKDIADCDWVIEAIIENLDIKKNLFDRVEKFRKPGSLISSNTSGIPIALMSEGRSEDFQKHFCGTHFFNPPRYLELLEIIPGPKTTKEVLNFWEEFGSKTLGKTALVAKDTPAFIANRIGVYSIMNAFHLAEKYPVNINDVDALTGTLLKRQKSATFRTSDVVGLDTLAHVAKGLKAACPKDEARALFEFPKALNHLLENNFLGSKSGQGFYKKIKSESGSKILALNLNTLEYEEASKPHSMIEQVKAAGGFKQRLLAMINHSSDLGKYLREHFAGLFAYSCNRVPEIANHIYLIDQAMRAGFGWSHGPFELMDVLGFETVGKLLKEGKHSIPNKMQEWMEKNSSWYSNKEGLRLFAALENMEWKEIPGQDQFILLNQMPKSAIVWENSGAKIWDLGDGILNVEFTSKMNTLGGDVLQGINKGIELAEKNYEGLVIANQGNNFSVGANLAMVFMMALEQDYDELDFAIRAFQNTTMRARYSAVPVVVATQGMCFGGGCELALHADHVLTAAECYMGLVEFGVGLIPGGGGSKELTRRASLSYGEGDIKLNTLKEHYLSIAMGKVSTSGHEAFDLHLLQAHKDEVITNKHTLIQQAKNKVKLLIDRGYQQPIHEKIKVLGQSALGMFLVGAESMQSSHYISAHDRLISEKLAHVMCGGNLSGETMVSEQYLLDLEREAFLSLCGERKTLERIEHMLKKGKPLRN